MIIPLPRPGCRPRNLRLPCDSETSEAEQNQPMAQSSSPARDAPARPTQDDLIALTATLVGIADGRVSLDSLTEEQRQRLISAAGDVFCPDVVERRLRVKARQKRAKESTAAQDETVLASTGIRVLRDKPVFMTPNVFPPHGPTEEEHTNAEVGAERHCYVCKRKFTVVHAFYDQMCTSCGEFNFAKRSESADLSGRVALLTGGRVKIGYQAGIKLLRAGAQVIVTTRFARDAALRYAAEPDFADWGDRLEVFGLDLRHTPSVEAFCDHLMATRDRLDFIVNNACQTVRRPPEFYRHMMELEIARRPISRPPRRPCLARTRGCASPISSPRLPQKLHRASSRPVCGPPADEHYGTRVGGRLSAEVSTALGLVQPAALSQLRLVPDDGAHDAHLFPEGRLDQDLQQVDLRDRNSWRLLLGEVSSVELLETQLVNAVAPFVLNGRLKPLMLRTPNRDKHIVNVSAVEGQFYRRFKTTRHPHTNMAKAALNMMTRTSAVDYDGIGHSHEQRRHRMGE